MRSIISVKPQFDYSLKADHPVAKKFYDKYNKIDSILDNNFEILKMIHQESCLTMNVFVITSFCLQHSNLWAE